MPDRKKVRVGFDIVTRRTAFVTMTVPDAADQREIKNMIEDYLNIVGIGNADCPEHMAEFVDDAELHKWDHAKKGVHKVALDYVSDYHDEVHTQTGASDLTN